MPASLLPKNSVRLSWPTSQSVPINGTFRILDNGSPIVSGIPAWPTASGKIGSGLGACGAGPAGLGSGGLGAGRVGAGAGYPGVGAEIISRDLSLRDGVHALAVLAADAQGNAATLLTANVTLANAAGPRPITGLPTAVYDAQNDTLTIRFQPSPDEVI